MTEKTTGLLESMLGLSRTIMFPDVAPVGMVTEMEVALHKLIVTGELLRVTVLVPCDVPNPDPVIITCVPTGPVVAESDVITGAGFVEVLSDTLSKVAVDKVPIKSLVTAKPT